MIGLRGRLQSLQRQPGAERELGVRRRVPAADHRGVAADRPRRGESRLLSRWELEAAQEALEAFVLPVRGKFRRPEQQGETLRLAVGHFVKAVEHPVGVAERRVDDGAAERQPIVLPRQPLRVGAPTELDIRQRHPGVRAVGRIDRAVPDDAPAAAATLRAARRARVPVPVSRSTNGRSGVHGPQPFEYGDRLRRPARLVQHPCERELHLRRERIDALGFTQQLLRVGHAPERLQGGECEARIAEDEPGVELDGATKRAFRFDPLELPGMHPAPRGLRFGKHGVEPDGLDRRRAHHGMGLVEWHALVGGQRQVGVHEHQAGMRGRILRVGRQ